jgi:SNF2 family DNA or RNA helicase
MVDRFQMGMIDVLICTFGVGSTGITLTRSHTVILLDRPWTPGDTAQAEDRVRRIGQVSVNGYG